MARTEAPETLRNFFKQRFRWMFGMLQATFKHRGVYREPGAFGVKAFTLPNIFLFQFLFPLVSPVMDLVLLWTVFASIWGQTMHETSGLSPGAMEVFIFWAAFQTLELVVAAIALLLDRHGGWWRLLPLVVVQRFCYRQLLYWVAIRSTGAAVRGRLVSWSKLLRTGRVQAAPLSSPPSEIGAKVSQEAA
jgi:cellulose synthase/poly-beta-1,6-N-acetylglucosamine synthase-like glycosyltransferase